MAPVDRGEGLRRIWVVAERELRERAGSRSFKLSTLAALALVVALIALPALVGTSKTYHVGLAGQTPPATATALTAQGQAADHEIAVARYDSVAAGEQAVRDKDVDVLLVDGTRLEWRGNEDATLSALVANAMQAVHIREQATRLGISTGELAQLLDPVPLTSRQIGTSHNADKDANTVALAAIVALFMAISFYGGFVLTAVVQEKSNRVAEVLLARMPAREILAGKVLGIGAVGLAQFTVLAVAAAVTAKALGADAPNIPGAVLAWAVVWFVLGYAFYSVVYAALGATTSRVEDAQSAIAPVTVVLIAGYVATLFAQDSPDSAGAVLLSFLPPSAPFVLPMRVALGAAPTWQLAASAVISAIATWGVVRAAGRIYTGALLRTGARVRLREAWHSSTGRRQ